MRSTSARSGPSEPIHPRDGSIERPAHFVRAAVCDLVVTQAVPVRVLLTLGEIQQDCAARFS